VVLNFDFVVEFRKRSNQLKAVLVLFAYCSSFFLLSHLNLGAYRHLQGENMNE